MFPEVSRLEKHFGFVLPVSACPIGHARKLRARKIERDELNLSKPDFLNKSLTVNFIFCVVIWTKSIKTKLLFEEGSVELILRFQKTYY